MQFGPSSTQLLPPLMDSEGWALQDEESPSQTGSGDRQGGPVTEPRTPAVPAGVGTGPGQGQAGLQINGMAVIS